MINESILIKNGWVLTLDENKNIYKNGYVFIENKEIVEVGNNVEIMKYLEKKADKVIDATSKIVMPGLINSHTHLFQTFMRGLADDKPLWKWLKEEIWPFASIMTEEDFYLAALLGCIENIKCGATSVIDQHYIYTSKNNADRVAEAMVASGIRGNLSRCFANQNYYPQFMENEQEILNELKRVTCNWHGKAGRITVSIGPLNPWGCSADLLKKSYDYASSNNLVFQIHTAETKKVVQTTLDSYGKRNVVYFHDLGVLHENTQLVHAVWLDDNELELIKEKGASIVHCPVANMYLASGTAPVPEMLNMGINVCLATDGPGSNNSQDMVSVLKFTACLHKVNTLNSTIMNPTQILEMATYNGAKAQGVKDLGRLKKGYKADVILVDYLRPHIAPVHNPESALVYNCNGNDVDTVIIDGKVVVENKKVLTIDEQKLLVKCQERIFELRKGLSK